MYSTLLKTKYTNSQSKEISDKKVKPKKTTFSIYMIDNKLL